MDGQMKIKPILFNTDMVCAILEGRKTVTRRVVKPQPNMFSLRDGIRAPYRPGDILYVQERWKCSPDSQLWREDEYRVVFMDGEVVRFYFECQERREKWRKYIDKPLNNWQSPYFMPREAARIFLRAKDVRVEKLQDMPHDGPLKEGIRWRDCPDGFTWKDDSEIYRCYTTPMGAMRALWDSTIKPADRALYGWDASPWVWVIEFERISKKEALKIAQAETV